MFLVVCGGWVGVVVACFYVGFFDFCLVGGGVVCCLFLVAL